MECKYATTGLIHLKIGLTTGEVGCMLSHVTAWSKIVVSGQAWCDTRGRFISQH